MLAAISRTCVHVPPGISANASADPSSAETAHRCARGYLRTSRAATNTATAALALAAGIGHHQPATVCPARDRFRVRAGMGSDDRFDRSGRPGSAAAMHALNRRARDGRTIAWPG
jgi:hypothetical protein